MKKFIMITPLQPVELDKETGEITKDLLRVSVYKAVDNALLAYDQPTGFPIIPVINAYAKAGEEIRLIAVTPDTDSAMIHVGQLQKELDALQERKGFICSGVEVIKVTYAGDVETQIEIFEKLMDYFEDGDKLYGCMTYGNKPMPIAEMMAIQYAYRVLRNVTIECLVYGELDHSKPDHPMSLFDITSLIRLDEIVRVMADQKISEPQKFLHTLLRARRGHDEG